MSNYHNKERIKKVIKELENIIYLNEDSEYIKDKQITPFDTVDTIRPIDEFDNKLEDAVTGIINAYKERRSILDGKNIDTLVTCDLIRGAIRDLAHSLGHLGCEREARNILNYIEDGVAP